MIHTNTFDVLVRSRTALRLCPVAYSKRVPRDERERRSGAAPLDRNPLQDFIQNWEEFKRHIQRSREAPLGAQHERLECLENIISVGTEIKARTGDPVHRDPVD